MKPGQEQDQQPDQHETAEQGSAPRHPWLVPGGQTWQELGENEPTAEHPSLGLSVRAGGTRALPDFPPAGGAGLPVSGMGALVGGTRLLSETQSYPSGPGPVPVPLAGGTALLDEAPRDPPARAPVATIPGAPTPASPVARAPASQAARAETAILEGVATVITPRARTLRPPPEVPPSVATAPAEWKTGARIGKYEIIRELGSGGMGIVFLARDNQLGRKVAIKFLQTGTPELTRRFLVEARATAQCSHENIVSIHEVGESGSSPFMVLEYLQGQSLEPLIKKSAPLSPPRAAELMISVVRALACAHEQGIVHRDLKPENIFLTDSGTVKVLDFGIAKVLRDEQQGTLARGELPTGRELGEVGLRVPARTGIIGTMAYMSPEQWGIGGEIDPRTDIWASGIILFEMLSGLHPLETVGPDPFTWVRDLASPMPSLRQIEPKVPVELAAVVDSCLRKRQDERLPDAASLLRALEPFLPGRFQGSRAAQPIDSGPYAGLRSFQEEDAGRFFGRSQEIAAIVTRIQDFPLLAAVGPSGIGKSSFVRAGLVPALKASGESWEALVVRPGRDPLLALGSLLAPLVGRTASGLDPAGEGASDDLAAQKEWAARLAAEPGHFGSALRTSARRRQQRVLLFVDQFEELFTLGADTAARRAFTACLAAAADDATSPVRVILSLRSDFLGRVAEDPHFINELTKGLFFLGPPSTEGLREALAQPAEMVGYRFETPSMIDEMVNHLQSTPGALPLLQFTAAQLWETRDPRRKLLTKQGYDALGGISGALVRHADRVIEKLPGELQSLARWLFPHLVTRERTRAVRDVAELREIAANAGDFDRLLDRLVDARLLVVQTSGGGAGTIEIVHESLIETWPTLRRWLDESHEDSVFLDQLWAAARQWQSNKRARGLLWNGDIVDELVRFRRRYRGELPGVVGAFADSVVEQRERGARRRRRLLSAGAVVGVGLLAAAGVALVVISSARKAAEDNALVAKRAEGDAQRRLREVEAKERERQKAVSLRSAAEKQAASAANQVKLTNEELALKNEELTEALSRTKIQREKAEQAQVRAETNESAAKQAKGELQKSNSELAKLLQKERERADRLNTQLGTLVEMLR